MITKTYNIVLQIGREDIVTAPAILVQNDKDVYAYEIKIYDGNKEIDYSEIDIATITFALTNNAVIQSDPERLVLSSTGIYYELGTSEISYPGMVLASVQLYGADGERLSTSKFKFPVQNDLITPGAVQSDSNFPLLQKLLQDIEQLKTDIVNLEVSDGALLDVKLSDAAGQIKDKVTTLQNEVTVHKTDLASQSTGKGASLIGIEDADENFTATNVEGALAEVKTEVESHKAETMQYEGRKFKVFNPYKDSGLLPLKGQLHCHTTNSDGVNTPAELATKYKNLGYAFVNFTDHDVITSDPAVDGIIGISGIEETARRHFVAIDVESQSISRNSQEILDFHRDNGKMTSIAHPTWPANTDFSREELVEMTGYNFIEVYNPTYSTGNDEQWDYALSVGKRVFGVAVDDHHSDASHPMNMGYVVVYCDENSKTSILQSLRDGKFYASTGNDINISMSDNIVTASSTELSNIKIIGRNGLILKADNNVLTSSYTIKGDEKYIRAVSTKASDGLCAWSQPIFIDSLGNDEIPYSEIVKSTKSNMHRQALINGNFDVWQRGTSFTNPAHRSWTADRWKVEYSANGGTFPNIVHSREDFNYWNDLKNIQCFYRITSDGDETNLGASSYYVIRQTIEHGTKLLCFDGDSIYGSFWARSTIPNKKIRAYFNQRYGTGGTPSATVNIGGGEWTLTPYWKKYKFKVTAATLQNRTFGTNNDDCLEFAILLQSSTSAISLGGGTIDIAQAQVSLADLPFTPKDEVNELRDCQWFYQKFYSPDALHVATVMASSTTQALGSLVLTAPMRKTPTLKISNYADVNLFDGSNNYSVSNLAITSANQDNSRFTMTITAVGLTAGKSYILVLRNGVAMEFDSELQGY